MSIRPKNKDSWQVRIYRGVGPDGKKQYDTYTIKGTRKDAERFEREKLHAMDKGTYVAPTKLTFKDHAEYWIANYVSLLRRTTRASYETLLRRHAYPAIGHIQLEKLAPKDLQTLYTSRLKSGLSPRRVQYLHTVISGCLKYGVELELLNRNVAEAVKAPRPRRTEAAILNADELEVLLGALKGHFLETIVILAVGTGLRRGEILALRWKDVNLDAGSLVVQRTIIELKDGLSYSEPKTTRGKRSVELPAFVVSALRQHKARQAAKRLQLGQAYQDHGLVCAHDDGAPWRPSTITNSFANVVKKVGLPAISFHGLRHTHASLLLAEGVHPKVVQERLGHSTISITLDTYSHVIPSLQKEAADKLDRALAGGVGRPSV